MKKCCDKYGWRKVRTLNGQYRVVRCSCWKACEQAAQQRARWEEEKRWRELARKPAALAQQKWEQLWA